MQRIEMIAPRAFLLHPFRMPGSYLLIDTEREIYDVVFSVTREYWLVADHNYIHLIVEASYFTGGR